MIVAVPVLTPVTAPVVPIVAIPVALVLQVPPPVAVESELVPPTQIPVFPLIVPGPAFTETVAVAEQPARL